ncbi:FtsK/SpoIIIE domain-containing protein [Catenuloplanes atrovinosus]|uniref:DNA polymerase III delta prime subunit n=1 Tax=Catenuloplanes atrovinosus TaxID=137266 RepID=A0AAE3YLP7_9ACTN|nr:FtsK/SpoIIIE domain-containing protein [Catenuloplanes atrovinosus]MDR7274533.1 DNA polymerase III delta prime subunit [Catenuloplanes atrovinosus]
MPDSRTTSVDQVRRALSYALGRARGDLADAERELDTALARLDRLGTVADEVPVRAARQRDARLAEIDELYATKLATLTRQAAEAGDREAPGAAGDGWDEWKPTPAERGQVAPELRIGAVRIARTTPVPALVPLLDRAHVHLSTLPEAEDAATARQIAAGDAEPAHAPGYAETGDRVVTTLLLRALGTAPPGQVHITGYDPEQLGGGLAGFAALANAGLLTFVGPGGLSGLLDGLVDHIRRINEKVLAGAYTSLRELARAEGRRPEPWRIAVLLGAGRKDELTPHEQAQLERIARTGVACGVHLIVRGLPMPSGPAVERVRTGTGGRVRVGGLRGLPVVLDPPPPARLVTETSTALARRAAEGPAPVRFADLLPAEFWRESSAEGLVAPVGEDAQGRPVPVTLADYPPHALIAGPSGTGKTNLIYAWMGALAARYSPGELEFYLLDFKEGVSFARFAPGRRDPSWLPHVRLVGVNVNTDREFGLALLRFLGEELRRRADAAKAFDATKLPELRAEDPAGHWPRIVAVIDEFQVLLNGRDAVVTESVNLLDDLARRGRSQGIHLVLASQDVSGIEALWGRPSLVAQFSLRIALPKARKVLPEQNTAADTLPRHHAIVNPDSGAPEANRILRVPPAGDREAWGSLQRELWTRRPEGSLAPRLFDGDAIPRLETAPDFVSLAPGADPAGRRWATGMPVALLGEAIDVQARSARLALNRAPGRNLAVLGTRADEACAVLNAAARSLAAQYPDGGARFSVAVLDASAALAVDALHGILPPDRTAVYHADNVTALLRATAAGLEDEGDEPHFLLLYAVDAVTPRLARSGPAPAQRRGIIPPVGAHAGAAPKPAGPDQPAAAPTGLDDLRRILTAGPEHHTHVLGWWRQPGRLRDDLGGIGSRTDAIGAWLALDVHGSELSQFYPDGRGPAWYPRPWRGLFFDRAVHRVAEAIIPYGWT